MEIKGCSCGREHYCAVDEVLCGFGAVSKVAEFGKKHKKCLAVYDENTFSAYSSVGGSFEELTVSTVAFPGSPLLIPDEKAIERIESAVSGDIDCLIGIGGGTINDLCKFVAHKQGLYYIYVATAPSMDGYASDGAALILDGMKVTLKTSPPRVIICDTAILKNAPIELIRAGIGDIVGKFSCLNDWLLAAYIKGEYICKSIYDRVYECTRSVADNIDGILNRDGDAIALLTDALIRVGVEMSYAGSSRPASGSEHHLAHFFEIHAIEHGHKHQPHGVDVGQASYYTALLRDKLLAEELRLNFDFEFTKYFQRVKMLLPRAFDGILALQNKTAFHGNANGNFDKEGIKEVLLKAPRADKVEELLSRAGLSSQGLKEFYGEALVNDALKYGKELKDRFTVLWLYEYYGWENMEI